MRLYDQWTNLIENQTDSTFRAFWDKYCDTEARIYSALLDAPGVIVEGVFRDLAQTWRAEAVYCMGFLDGVRTSLRDPLAIEDMTEDSPVRLDIDLEKLYFNMLAAKAEHLYKLPQWDGLLSAEKRGEIQKEQRKAGTVVKGDAPGRNDLCPCGSGKKYKKCCGAGA
jgi:hypothetical protein